MSGVFTPTVPIVPGTDFYEEAKENFRRRIEEPVEVFRENLQQGTTGPAPALVTDEDGNVQLESPYGYYEINNTAAEVLTGTTDPYEQINREATDDGTGPREFVVRIVALLALVGAVLVVLNAFLTGVGEGLGARATGADDV